MELEIDIYISHFIDKNSKSNSYQKWVENFKSYTKWLLKKIIKKDLTIITSYELTQNEDVSLNYALKNAKCLLVIFSPEYTSSVQYQNEIQLILNQKNLVSDTKENIFKVYKYPVALKDIPKELHESFSYDLYVQNTENDEITEFNDFFGEEEENIFWFKIVDLCYDLSFQLSDSQQHQLGNKSIYIAEVGEDQRFHRDMIKRDFLMKGYDVLPKTHLPTKDLNNLEDQILEHLSHCEYSIHILGDEPGRVIDKTELNIVDFQNQVAAKYSQQLNKMGDEYFHRFIWVPPNLKLYNQKQLIRIDNLKRNTKEIENAEIIETPLEVFRSLIRNRMDETKKSEETKIRTNTNINKHKIYIIFEFKEKQNENIKEIIDVLKAEKLSVSEPDFGDDQRILINTHKKKLVDSDTILIFYNNSGSQWLSSKIHDIIKSPGYGKTKPFIGNFVFVSNDENNVIKDIKTKLNGIPTLYQNVEENTIKDKLPEYLKSIIKTQNG